MIFVSRTAGMQKIQKEITKPYFCTYNIKLTPQRVTLYTWMNM